MTKTKKVLSLPIYIAIFAGVAVLCVVLDQLTKLWIFDQYFGGNVSAKPLQIIKDFFALLSAMTYCQAFKISTA